MGFEESIQKLFSQVFPMPLFDAEERPEHPRLVPPLVMRRRKDVIDKLAPFDERFMCTG